MPIVAWICMIGFMAVIAIGPLLVACWIDNNIQKARAQRDELLVSSIQWPR